MEMENEYIGKYLKCVRGIVGELLPEKGQLICDILERVYEDGFADGVDSVEAERDALSGDLES